MNPPPITQAPGAGLPFPQSWFVRMFGRAMLRRRRLDDALDDIEAIALRLATCAEALTDEWLTTPRLIAPMRGLEDSSRCWSPVMVLEHLSITGTAMLDMALALSQGQPVQLVVSTASVKPRGEKGREVIEEFRALHLGARARLREGWGADTAGLLHPHPWFGLLNATDWVRLTAFHLRLHERQMTRILA